VIEQRTPLTTEKGTIRNCIRFHRAAWHQRVSNCIISSPIVLPVTITRFRQSSHRGHSESSIRFANPDRRREKPGYEERGVIGRKWDRYLLGGVPIVRRNGLNVLENAELRSEEALSQQSPNLATVSPTFQVIAAKIQCDLVQPGCEFSCRSKFFEGPHSSTR
jgi:hypothetical protein